MKIIDLIGHISQENIDTLQKYAKLTVDKEKTGNCFIVDIGTCAGKSAIAMALVDKDIQVLTVDPFPNKVYQKNVDVMKVSDRVSLYKITSEEFAARETLEYSMCFIDGLHTYHGVKNDIEGIVKKVRKGGYILFHDCNLYFNTVKKAVEEYEGKYYEFIEEVGGRWKPTKEGSIYVARRI